MSRGKVVYFNDQTQFGIIQKYNGGGVLVESGALRESGLTTLFEGQRLSFEIVNHNQEIGRASCRERVSDTV